MPVKATITRSILKITCLRLCSLSPAYESLGSNPNCTAAEGALFVHVLSAVSELIEHVVSGVRIFSSIAEKHLEKMER